MNQIQIIRQNEWNIMKIEILRSNVRRIVMDFNWSSSLAAGHADGKLSFSSYFAKQFYNLESPIFLASENING
jgi:hypothetical protein